MEYRRLGKAGVKVSRLCLGAGVRGELDEARFVRTVERAIDLGCNFVDCADNYGRGRSEPLLGQAIKGKRDNLVITSKVFSAIGPSPNDRGLSRYHIMTAAERSLTRLQTDRIDIYYLHNVDPDTEPEETMRAMEDLVRQGKVRYVGASNHSAARAVELLWIADRLRLEPIACLQNEYNLLRRWPVEPDLFPICRRFGLGLMTYSPLAVGLLSGRYRRGQPVPAGGFWRQEQLADILTERGDRVVQTLIELGEARGATPGQMAMAWLLSHPEISAPIVGADSPEYVEELFGALEIELSPDERMALDAVSRWDELVV